MKNQKRYYWIVWGIALVIFHVIMFVLPDEVLSPKDSRFWVIYVTLLASFIGQAVCSHIYASKEKKEERFLYIPVIMIGYIALLMTLLLALQAIVLKFLPDWFTIIVALLVAVYYAFAVIRTLAAAEMVVAIDKKVAEQTNFVYSMTTKAKALEQSAPAELCPYVKKVYEGFRYSDPVSSVELVSIEEEIKTTYESFAAAVKENKKENAEVVAQSICNLLKERNELCKLRKE